MSREGERPTQLETGRGTRPGRIDSTGWAARAAALRRRQTWCEVPPDLCATRSRLSAPGAAEGVGPGDGDGPVEGRQGSARALRFRRRVISLLADEVATVRPASRVLAIGAGGLREAGLSRALTSGGIAEWIALEKDEASLRRLRTAPPAGPVRTIEASVRDLLTGRPSFEGMDFTYAAGLLDLLPDRAASALVSRMLAFTGSGGIVLVTNLLPGIGDRGGPGEAPPIRRDHAAMMRLLAPAESEIGSCELFTDSDRTMLYAQLTRA